MMDADERELFEQSLQAAVDSATGADLDAALVDIGWSDALDVEPRVATSALFAAQGRSGSTSSALGWAMTHRMGLGDVSLVLPAIGSNAAPAAVEGGSVVGSGLVLASAIESVELAVVVADGSRFVAHRVTSESVERRAVEGIDGRVGLAEVSIDGPSAGEFGSVDWEGALALGHIALSHELAGVSRAMLDLARDHALERIQFGRPIASFQAVRHRLADTLIAIESTESAIDGAWLDGSPFAASIAKAVAGRGARVAARHCQQVLAGIGFTAEHPLHHFIRRALVLDALLGSSDVLTRQLGQELSSSRRLPSMLPL